MAAWARFRVWAISFDQALRLYLEGPSSQCLRTLVPKTIQGMASGTRVLEYWVLGPSGLVLVLTCPFDASGEPWPSTWRADGGGLFLHSTCQLAKRFLIQLMSNILRDLIHTVLP